MFIEWRSWLSDWVLWGGCVRRWCGRHTQWCHKLADGRVRRGRAASKVVRVAVIALTLIAVLNRFGVQTTSLIALVGAAGLAIGLALQGTLSNIAAGIMLIWLRPMSIGEYITGDGVAGVVVEIGLFGTRLRSTSGLYIFTRNSKLWNSAITNHSRESLHQVIGDFSFEAIKAFNPVDIQLSGPSRRPNIGHYNG